MGNLETRFSLRGKVALVGGASRGIGLAIARGLAEAGAQVLGAGRSPQPVEAYQGSARYVTCDVRDTAAFRQLCETLGERHGRLDIYVHAAGVSFPAAPPAEARAAFAQTVETNLLAAYSCCLAASEQMATGEGGSIIVITSIGGWQGFPRNPGYAASKGALRVLTKALAVDLGEQHIRVNAIAPGYIRTAMTEESYQDPARHRDRLDRMILKRWGDPDDLVGAAIFLASAASSYVTGQEIVVDGGWLAKGL